MRILNYSITIYFFSLFLNATAMNLDIQKLQEEKRTLTTLAQGQDIEGLKKRLAQISPILLQALMADTLLEKYGPQAEKIFLNNLNPSSPIRNEIKKDIPIIAATASYGDEGLKFVAFSRLKNVLSVLSKDLKKTIKFAKDKIDIAKAKNVVIFWQPVGRVSDQFGFVTDPLRIAAESNTKPIILLYSIPIVPSLVENEIENLNNIARSKALAGQTVFSLILDRQGNILDLERNQKELTGLEKALKE